MTNLKEKQQWFYMQLMNDLYKNCKVWYKRTSKAPMDNRISQLSIIVAQLGCKQTCKTNLQA